MIAASVPNFFDPHSGHADGFKGTASSCGDPGDCRRRSNLTIATRVSE
jgi:hypothetical protein